MSDHSEELPRIVVVQPEPPDDLAGGWLGVGVMGWRAAGPHLTVIAKATLSYARSPSGPAPGRSPGAPELARLCPEPCPISLEQASLHEDAAADELHYPSDFVPLKPAADVLVVGHAHAGKITDRIVGRIEVAGLRRNFAVQAEERAPSLDIALSRARLAAGPDPTGEGLGPVAVSELPPDGIHGDGFDFAQYQAAPPSLRLPAIPPDARVTLEGLALGGQPRVIELPGLVVHVTVEASWGAEQVPLSCDTLWIDTDEQQICLVWRGAVDLRPEAGGVRRIIAALEHRDRPRDHATRLAYLQRGRIHYAVRESDLLPRAEPIPEDDLTLQMAIYETWGSHAPEPRLPLERYAVISAELVEWPERRTATLSRHGFDENRWTVEERGWLERISEATMAGDTELVMAYGERFVTAQDALATEQELCRTLADYLDISDELQRDPDLAAVLGRHGLTTPQWMRLERRWIQAAASRSSPA